MVDKSLCIDFVDAILAHYDYKLNFETFITEVRNVITALEFDKTIQKSEVPIAARYMIEQVADVWKIDQSWIDQTCKIFPRLTAEFDTSTIGPIIQSVNAKRIYIGPDGKPDKSKMTPENIIKNGYKLVAIMMMKQIKKCTLPQD